MCPCEAIAGGCIVASEEQRKRRPFTGRLNHNRENGWALFGLMKSL